VHASTSSSQEPKDSQGQGTPDMTLFGDFSKGGREALSPGAGLASAEEQADAAYADLMYTSMVGPDGPQSEEEADAAWQECLGMASTDTRSDINKNAKSRGVLGDVLELFNALKGGAHIVKKKDGRV